MKKLLLALLLLSCAPALAAPNKEGMPIGGVPGWPPGFGFCVAVKGVEALTCFYADRPTIEQYLIGLVKDAGLPTIASLSGNQKIADAAQRVIFPEFGDALDPKAAGYCVCAADAQGVDITGSPFEKPTNSGKGGCTYWMVCYIKGVPGPK